MIISRIDNEDRCSECWATIDPIQDICDDCSHQIDEEEDGIEREHIANEISQYRNQLVW